MFETPSLLQHATVIGGRFGAAAVFSPLNESWVSSP